MIPTVSSLGASTSFRAATPYMGINGIATFNIPARTAYELQVETNAVMRAKQTSRAVTGAKPAAVGNNFVIDA